MSLGPAFCKFGDIHCIRAKYERTVGIKHDAGEAIMISAPPDTIELGKSHIEDHPAFRGTGKSTGRPPADGAAVPKGRPMLKGSWGRVHDLVFADQRNGGGAVRVRNLFIAAEGLEVLWQGRTPNGRPNRWSTDGNVYVIRVPFVDIRYFWPSRGEILFTWSKRAPTADGPGVEDGYWAATLFNESRRHSLFDIIRFLVNELPGRVQVDTGTARAAASKIFPTIETPGYISPYKLLGQLLNEYDLALSLGLDGVTGRLDFRGQGPAPESPLDFPFVWSTNTAWKKTKQTPRYVAKEVRVVGGPRLQEVKIEGWVPVGEVGSRLFPLEEAVFQVLTKTEAGSPPAVASGDGNTPTFNVTEQDARHFARSDVRWWVLQRSAAQNHYTLPSGAKIPPSAAAELRRWAFRWYGMPTGKRKLLPLLPTRLARDAEGNRLPITVLADGKFEEVKQANPRFEEMTLLDSAFRELIDQWVKEDKFDHARKYGFGPTERPDEAGFLLGGLLPQALTATQRAAELSEEDERRLVEEMLKEALRIVTKRLEGKVTKEIVDDYDMRLFLPGGFEVGTEKIRVKLQQTETLEMIERLAHMAGSAPVEVGETLALLEVASVFGGPVISYRDEERFAPVLGDMTKNVRETVTAWRNVPIHVYDEQEYDIDINRGVVKFREPTGILTRGDLEVWQKLDLFPANVTVIAAVQLQPDWESIERPSSDHWWSHRMHLQGNQIRDLSGRSILTSPALASALNLTFIGEPFELEGERFPRLIHRPGDVEELHYDGQSNTRALIRDARDQALSISRAEEPEVQALWQCISYAPWGTSGAVTQVRWLLKEGGVPEMSVNASLGGSASRFIEGWRAKQRDFGPAQTGPINRNQFTLSE